jgi:peptidoglycan/xylan/chitin deacetylase (PgdA/CDA1 family)
VSRLSPSSLLRRARGRGRSAALILCYHRIARVETDPWLLCVPPEHFGEHIDVLRATADVVPLDRLVSGLHERERRRGRPLVALTFDDGYADNLHQAKPLLEAADLAATVFVVSGAVGRRHEFWWDELERIFLSPGTTAEKLELHTNGTTSTWRLSDAPYSAADHDRHRNWNAIGTADPLPRHRQFRSAYAALRAASEAERAAAMSALLVRREAGARESHRPLSEQELRRLADGGLVTIGAHTVTHPVLSEVSNRDQQRQVEQSKAELETLLGRRVREFAYPFGQREHYSAATVKAVREAGYALACSTVPGVVHRRTSRFELPRFTVLDWDGDRFAQALAGWTAG